MGKTLSNASRLLRAARARLARLPRVGLVGAVGVVLVTILGGGLFMYETFDYVQHDNDFCLSCHIMRDPWERFSESAHRGLGCKACHQPNLIERTKMALRQVAVHPEAIETHAEVPDSRCESCHLEGDWEDWILVGESRGHRLHLESGDLALREVTCLTCHSEAVHDVAPTNQSCAASGCHDDVPARLGEMAEHDTPCVVCHDFKAPQTEAESTSSVEDLRPGMDACLSCHDMRSRIRIDEETEPHQAVCGLCHNMHEQERAADAVPTCSEADCHSQPREIEDDHHRWEEVDIDNCVQCHAAHTFEVQGDACLSCHEDVLRDPGRTEETPVVAATGWPVPSGFERSASGPSVGVGEPLLVTFAHSRTAAQAISQQQTRDTVFTHERHRSVGCRSCHTSETSVVDDDPQWCVNCHHPARSATSCTRCHSGAEMDYEIAYEAVFRLPSGPKSRTLDFPHAEHGEVDCAECHGSPPTARPDDFGCASCHDDHHQAEGVDCLSCHVAPQDWAHDTSLVHETCSGGVCHSAYDPDPPPPALAWPQSLCLACHQDFLGVDPFPTRPGGG